MPISFFQVDAFTHQPFKGNQAGVCLPDRALDALLMQQIATENNLAETAFVQRQGERFQLRWFTPSVELPLCGHGTIATAHVLWEQGIVPQQQGIVFSTLSGDLPVKTLEGGWIELDFPAFDTTPASLPAELQTLFPRPQAVCYTNDRFLVELEDETAVRTFQPDFEKLSKHRVVITAKADTGTSVDFVSRYFAVPVGVPEDPVTGSAHCSLAPYWAAKLQKTEMLAYQASQRGGYLRLVLHDRRVRIAGQAVTLIKG